ALAAGPDERLLDSQLEAWVRQDAIQALLTSASQKLDECRRALSDADASAAEREEALANAREAFEQALVRSGAADLRHALHEGEPCPVCEQVVVTLPTSPVSRDINGFKGAVDTAQRGYNQAQ